MSVLIIYVMRKNNLSYLRFGPGGGYKTFNKSYDNVLGFRIPDLLMNLLSCNGFLKNNDSVVILKCPNRIYEYYLNKRFFCFILIKTI